MVLDETFYVTGVGTVVSGTVTAGNVKVGDTLLLGPDGNGVFKPVQSFVLCLPLFISTLLLLRIVLPVDDASASYCAPCG